MQKIIYSWLAFGLSLGVFASCGQDRNELNSATEVGGERVTLSLSAEVSVEDPSLRAMNYKLGANANGDLVPMPQFRDGQEVEVHTILKSSRGTTVAKTLKWKYRARSKKLILRRDTHDIEVSGFNNDNATKWYISGLIGGALNGTKVEFMGTRVVKGVAGNAGDALGSMEVPYAFGWTELTINTSSTRDSQGSHKYAEVPASKDVRFKPLGSMLAVKLGTNQSAGSYTFTPKGFVLSSNAWYDQGSFELSTTIPTTDPHKALPTWKEHACAGSMYYTFASGEAPGAIAHNQTTAKTYYVWVMPHATVPTTAEVRVMLKGTSSRPETDYTKTWFTDYTTAGKATAGKVTQGRVHALTAKATRRVALPIEYVTDYNLAGGQGLTYVPTNEYILQPPGVEGDLRFANSHRNNESGYYSWYTIVGRYHGEYNPQAASLQPEINRILGDKYYVPTHDQWWGVFPAPSLYGGSLLDRDDYMALGPSPDLLIRQSYLSDWSGDFGPDDSNGNAYTYAIRFKDRATTCSSSSASVSSIWYDDFDTNTIKSYTYSSAPDNSLKCAYRFQRIGSKTSWDNAMRQNDNMNLANQLIIDVVYLGEEITPTSLKDISNPQWWAAKQADGLVISKIFPASGYIHHDRTTSHRGGGAYYFSSSLKDQVNAWYVMASSRAVYGTNTWDPQNAFSVRLFMRRND